jgi:tetratricopeptide (TPR) repeat protein
LPAKAWTPLAKLSPPVARPANPANADELPERAVEPVKQAEEHMAKENYFQAEQLLSRASGFDPGNPRIQRDLGLTYAGLGNRAKAEPALAAAVKQTPDFVRLHLLLAQYAEIAGRTADAIVSLRTAVQCSDATDDNPDTAEAWLKLGGLLEREGCLAAALECNQKLLGLLAKNDRKYLSRPALKNLLTQPERLMIDQGRLLLSLNRPGEAAELLQRAYELDKSDPQAGRLCVEAMLASGRLDKAAEMVLELASEPSQLDFALALAGQLCRTQKDPQAPRKLLELYVKRGGRNAAFAIAMAELAAEAGQTEQAAQMLSEHMASVPDSGRLVLRLASIHARTGNTPAAAEQLARLMTMDVPESPQALTQLRQLARQAKPDSAKALAEAAAKQDKLKPALLTAAGILAEPADEAAAAKYLNQAVAADAAFWPAYEALERLYVAAGDFAALDEMLLKLNKGGGDDFFRLYLIGRSQFDRGRLQDAMVNLQKALSRKTYAPALVLLGRANVQLAQTRSASRDRKAAIDDLDEAEKRLTEALQLAPDDFEAVQELYSVFMLRGQPERALRAAQAFLQANPKSVPARLLLARLSAESNRPAEARQIVAAVLAEAPNDVDARLMELRLELPAKLATTLPAAQAKPAVAKLQAILKQEPKNIAANQLYAAMLANQAQYAESAKLWQELHKRRPFDAAFAAAYLDALIKSKQSEKAVQVIQQIADSDTAGTVMRRMLLANLSELGRADLAEAMLEKWLARPTSQTDLDMLRAEALQMYAKAKRFDKAQAMLDRWIAEGPPEELLRMLRLEKLRTYGQSENHDEAVTYARKWRSSDPTNTVPERMLIALLVEAKQYEKAQKVIDEWLAETNESPARLQLRASKLLVLAEMGNFDALMAYHEKWAQEQKESPDPYRYAIRALREKEKHELALKVAESWLAWQEKLVRQDKSQAKTLHDAQTVVVNCLLAADKFDAALERARGFAGAYPGQPDVMRSLYAALSLADKEDEALALLEKLQQQDPEDESFCNDLGYHLADKGKDLDKAEQLIRKALAARPDQVAYKDSLGWVLYKKGSFAEAKMIFDQVADVEDKELHAVILDHAADNAWRLGSRDEAIRLWTRAVEVAKAAKHKDRETKAILAQTPRKIELGKARKDVPVAPLGRGVALPGKK